MCLGQVSLIAKSREGLILLKKEQPNSSNGQKIWTALHKRFGTGPYAPKRCFTVLFRTRTLVIFSFVHLFWGGVLRTNVYQMPGSLHCLKRIFGPKEIWSCVGHVVLCFFRFRYLPFNGRAENNWGCVFCQPNTLSPGRSDVIGVGVLQSAFSEIIGQERREELANQPAVLLFTLYFQRRNVSLFNAGRLSCWDVLAEGKRWLRLAPW